MNKLFIWGIWLVVTAVLGVYFGWKLFGDGDKRTFLVGEATYGHHQIEMACETCHTSAFGGTEVLQDACVQCHATELEDAHDSHPKSKFTDPRNADRVEILDARYCITCHTEHQKEQTHAMGVTLPDDYCYHCHTDIAEDRPSHEGLAFDSCASAGCHNYHDNRALYEDFLVKHAGQPWLKATTVGEAVEQSLPPATSVIKVGAALTAATSTFENQLARNPDIAHEWQASSHAAAGVDCGGCHIASATNEWLDKPDQNQCRTCHAFEVKGFLAGKHGMRLAGDLSASLSPISPGEGKLAFKAEAQHLTHGCNSCHGAHTFDPTYAAVEGCLNCHNDDHSLAFKESPHGALWQEKRGQDAPAETVTCATCHMPRTHVNIKGEQVLAVQHNQNENLRPNEKMIRSVCTDCHGLGFAIDALADPRLIENNFNGQPREHIESIDWALRRADDSTEENTTTDN